MEVVLAVDAFILFLLNLLKDVGTWLTVRFYEGLAMVFLGGASWGARAPYPLSTPRGEHTYKIRMKFKYSWFWVSLGMVGIVLWVLAAHLYWRYY